ncbi:molybdopterin molybdotransferase MoeA [Corynebacterium aquatimens]|uniref:molybdopterin molybdotransferase MoeA n=1 Tax=Corynebacterium TaxID=1716 RepID=UPI001F3CD533|nr:MULTISPECIES: molybdopterin molybdotransferase MoeA [Corynebacterium]QYH19888.1 molybdopterin molybdotransferase MoeA [Corynebacterium aquatimens]UIZ92951.1 molybdopterin molybdotransferase MoeA [Corynebacterium sp. CNCTC7651]
MQRTPEAHLAAVRELVPAREPRSTLLFDASLHHATLTEDVVATVDSPAFDNSQMDGYALGFVEAEEAQVGPTVPAGVDPEALYPAGLGSLAAPVMTGSKLPRGTVRVVPVEACEPPQFQAEGETVRVPPGDAGQFVRPRGVDVAAGDVIAPAGTRVGPALVATLAAQGIDKVAAQRPARILLVTGGREIGSAGAASIPDSNGPMLRALAARAGIEVAGHVRTDDDPSVLRQAVSDAVAGAVAAAADCGVDCGVDAIVTSGGISHGKFEVVRQVFSDHAWYGHVAQQPGGPQGVSTFDGIPVISLPGNPVSTLVSFRLYVAPVLGHAPEPVRVPLAASAGDVRGLDGKDQFLRGRIEDGCALPVGGAGSHFIAQATASTCLIRVPAGAAFHPGDLTTVYPL